MNYYAGIDAGSTYVKCAVLDSTMQMAMHGVCPVGINAAQSAMVLMGEAPDPETGRTLSNLPEAKHTIDILAMLDCKTRGNLTSEEKEVLESLLCDLRMLYVKKQ